MKLVAPDFARRIDLPGAGPCPRPVDLDRASAGLRTLVSLRIYSFADGAVVDGEAEGDDVLVALMRGTARVEVGHNSHDAGRFLLSAEGGDRAVYLPPHATYRLSAAGACDVAYARAVPASAPREPAAFAPSAGRLDTADHAAGMTLTLARLDDGAPFDLGDGATAPEQLVHVRATGAGKATLGGAALGDWHTAVLGEGEAVSGAVTGGPIEMLTVSARTTG